MFDRYIPGHWKLYSHKFNFKGKLHRKRSAFNFLLQIVKLCYSLKISAFLDDVVPQVYINIEKSIMDGDWVKKVYDDFMDDPFGSHPYSISRMKDIVENFMSRCHKT